MVGRWQRMVIIRSEQLDAAFPRDKEERLEERGEEMRGREREDEDEREADLENEEDDAEDVDDPEESWSQRGSPGLGSRCRV